MEYRARSDCGSPVVVRADRPIHLRGGDGSRCNRRGYFESLGHRTAFRTGLDARVCCWLRRCFDSLLWVDRVTLGVNQLLLPSSTSPLFSPAAKAPVFLRGIL